MVVVVNGIGFVLADMQNQTTVDEVYRYFLLRNKSQQSPFYIFTMYINPVHSRCT